MTANERLEALANDLIGEAFCADWHGDPDTGVREVERIRKLFIQRLMEFAYIEIRLDRQTRLPRLSSQERTPDAS